jgi:uncharacterized protein YhfF
MDNRQSIEAFWKEFLLSAPQAAQLDGYHAWAFGSTSEAANALASLVMKGLKTATSSLVWSFETENEPFPKPGEYNLILDGEGCPVCITQTTEVEIKPFIEVDAAHARLEGEGDLSLMYWREVHWLFFTQECAAIGRSPDETMPVCCERFRLCWPLVGS